MSERFRIGLVGLDTSHVVAFARILNDADDPHHNASGRIVAGYPGGSPDMATSASRVDRYTAELRDTYGVSIEKSIEAVAEMSDAVFLESVDGRVHLEQFERIAPFGKPTFIDKPFATNTADAERIAELAAKHNVTLMSCSALRFAEPFTEALADSATGEIIGIDCAGPLHLEPTQPGLFWYGIHTVEMVYAALGAGFRRVTALGTRDHDVVCGEWDDGRLATIRGNRRGNNAFSAVIHREQDSRFVNASASAKPYYVSLIEAAMEMLRTGESPIDPAETVEIVRFIETANAARETGAGRPVRP